MTWVMQTTETLWRTTWVVIPLALLVALLCRFVARRPATRHALWLGVLASFLVPLVLPTIALPDWTRISSFNGTKRTDPVRTGGGWAGEAGSRPVEAAEKPKLNDVVLDTPARSYTRAIPLRSEAPRESGATPEVLAGRAARRESAPIAGNLKRSIQADESKSLGAGDVMAKRETRHEKRASAGDKGYQTGRPTDSSAPTPGSGHSAENVDSLILSSPSVAAGERSSQSQPGERPKSGASDSSSDGGSAWGQWLAATVLLRDILLGLPVLPMGIWVGGAALLLAWQILLIVRFRYQLGAAVPAPRSITVAVQDLAKRLGLPEAPETYLVESCVSPMIWCGRKARLILPLKLWKQLDRSGRTAILCHELAHLKRRDHWVCRLEMVIFALYWWHPVTWWARRRLYEEADLSCDAWVTWMMPQGRRAYAQALLKTKEFMSAGAVAAPAGAIGVTSVGARSLARRLTMVMTQQTKPRVSTTGVMLVLALSLVGWISTPARSCPPEEKAAKERKAAQANKEKAVKVKVWGDAGAKHECETPEAKDSETYERFLHKAGGQSKLSAEEQAKLQARLAELSKEMAELHRKLHAEHGAMAYTFSANGGLQALEELKALQGFKVEMPECVVDMPGLPGAVNIGTTSADGVTVLAVPGMAMAPHAAAGSVPPVPAIAPVPPVAAMAPVAPAAPRSPMQTWAQSGSSWGGQRAAGAPQAVSIVDGAVVIKVYKLSDGKLKALTELMLRDDVPIRVRAVDGGIEVHATPSQQAVFQGFVNVLESHDSNQTYKVSPPKLDSLWELLARDDVKVVVSRVGNGAIGIQASGPEHSAIEAFLRMIDPQNGGPGTPAPTTSWQRSQPLQPGVAAPSPAPPGGAGWNRDGQRRAELEARWRELALAAAQRSQNVMERQLAVVREAEAAQRAAERMSADAEVLGGQAEELEEAAEAAANAAARKAIEDQIRELENQVRKLEAEGREMERKARKMERRAERDARAAEIWSERSASFEQLLDRLTEKADALGPEVQSLTKKVHEQVVDSLRKAGDSVEGFEAGQLNELIERLAELIDEAGEQDGDENEDGDAPDDASEAPPADIIDETTSNTETPAPAGSACRGERFGVGATLRFETLMMPGGAILPAIIEVTPTVEVLESAGSCSEAPAMAR